MQKNLQLMSDSTSTKWDSLQLHILDSLCWCQWFECWASLMRSGIPLFFQFVTFNMTLLDSSFRLLVCYLWDVINILMVLFLTWQKIIFKDFSCPISTLFTLLVVKKEAVWKISVQPDPKCIAEQRCKNLKYNNKVKRFQRRCWKTNHKGQ